MRQVGGLGGILSWMHLQPERNGSVIHQRHLHVSAKLTGFDDRMQCPRLAYKVVEEPAAFLGWRGGREPD